MTLHDPILSDALRTNDTTLTPLLPKIYKRARVLTRTPEAADDLAQDCALKLWRLLRRGAQIDDLEAYAMITLRNLAITHWRTQPDTTDLQDDDAITEPSALSRLILEDTLRAFAELPPKQAAVMNALVDGETSPTALAIKMNLPKGTVMSRLARARATLRQLLER